MSNLAFKDDNYESNNSMDKATAIAEGRRKSAEATEWLRERIGVAQRLEKFLAKLDFEELVKLEGGIATVKHQKRVEAEEQRKAEAAKADAAQKIRELAAQAGLEVVVDGIKPATRATRSFKADPEKYAVHYEDTNQTYFWSGFGRSPLAFANAMDKGYKKPELLNQKTGKYLTLKTDPTGKK